MTRLCVFFLLIIKPLFDRVCHRLVTTISLFGDRGSRSNWYLSRYIAVLSGNSERAAVPPGDGIPDERAPARTAGGIEEYFHRVVQFSAPGDSSTRPGKRQQRAALAQGAALAAYPAARARGYGQAGVRRSI